MRRLGPMEFIDTATEPVEAEPTVQPTAADVAAVEGAVNAFGSAQMGDAKRSDSILRRITSELAGVQRKDGSTKVASATERGASDHRLGRASGKFTMARDWDPDDDGR